MIIGKTSGDVYQRAIALLSMPGNTTYTVNKETAQLRSSGGNWIQPSQRNMVNSTAKILQKKFRGGGRNPNITEIPNITFNGASWGEDRLPYSTVSGSQYELLRISPWDETTSFPPNINAGGRSVSTLGGRQAFDMRNVTASKRDAGFRMYMICTINSPTRSVVDDTSVFGFDIDYSSNGTSWNPMLMDGVGVRIQKLGSSYSSSNNSVSYLVVTTVVTGFNKESQMYQFPCISLPLITYKRKLGSSYSPSSKRTIYVHEVTCECFATV